MISDVLNKVHKVFVEEGFLRFCTRIARLGRYRLWLWRFFAHRRLRSDQAVVRGVPLDLSRRRSGIVEELQLYGVHEPVATAEYERLLSPGMRVLEVGTNLGYYLAVTAGRVGAAGRIVGFEPDPELFALASRNAGKLGVATEVFQFAASDVTGTCNFYQSEVGNWGSLKQDASLRQTGAVVVQAKTIDDFCGDHSFTPDALRMDIEGAEAMALRGACRIIEEHSPVIFVEMHKFLLSDDECRSILDVLMRGRYQTLTIVDRYYDWPWSLPSARKRAVVRMGMGEFSEYFMSSQCAKVFSVIASR